MTQLTCCLPLQRQVGWSGTSRSFTPAAPSPPRTTLPDVRVIVYEPFQLLRCICLTVAVFDAILETSKRPSGRFPCLQEGGHASPSPGADLRVFQSVPAGQCSNRPSCRQGRCKVQWLGGPEGVPERSAFLACVLLLQHSEQRREVCAGSISHRAAHHRSVRRRTPSSAMTLSRRCVRHKLLTGRTVFNQLGHWPALLALGMMAMEWD